MKQVQKLQRALNEMDLALGTGAGLFFGLVSGLLLNDPTFVYLGLASGFMVGFIRGILHQLKTH